MAQSYFIGGTDLTDITLARVDERDAIGTYASLIDVVRARCGMEVASLFAEPVKGTNRASGALNVAWYCGFEGTPFALHQLDAAGRQRVVDLLKLRLRGFTSLIADDSSGPVFASWLNILSPDGLMAVGGQPIIKSWGMLPTAIAASSEARDRHFRDGIGIYLPSMATPPFLPIEAQVFVATMERVGRRERAREAAPATTPPIDVLPPTGAAQIHPSHRWYGEPALRAPVIACTVAAVFLALLAFGNILRYPSGPTVPDAATIEAQRQTNDALRDRLSRLKEAATNVCRADAAPAGRGTPETNPLLPPSPSHTPIITKDPATLRPQTSTLGAVLEKATVLVVVEHSLGSGFFITDRYIVTNHHVVGDASTAKVGNKALGGLVDARVIAVGAGAARGTQDIAVLEIEPKAGIAFLSIGVTPDRLSSVTAAGFPGAVLDTIQQGRASALPEANFTQGIVTSRQIQDPAGIPTIIHTAQIGHGNSGGPLVDAGGCAVGINSWLALDEMDHITFSTYFQALDAAELRDFLQSHNVPFTPADNGCKPATSAPLAPSPDPAVPLAPQAAPQH